MVDKKTQQERIEPLMKRLGEVNARCTWEGYASLNTDRPRQKDIILQHWYTDRGYYIVQIWADGSGWNVFKTVDDTNSVEKTLAAIV
jgi:hypothetical protein